MPFMNGKWHRKMVTMAVLTLDKAGRIVLPKPLRDELNLSPGDTLEVRSSGEQITLQPVRSTTALQKERGVWVFRTGEKLPSAVVSHTLRSVREERERTILDRES
jgi:AbrB family looped-hinge helix DNA binding protein